MDVKNVLQRQFARHKKQSGCSHSANGGGYGGYRVKATDCAHSKIYTRAVRNIPVSLLFIRDYHSLDFGISDIHCMSNRDRAFEKQKNTRPQQQQKMCLWSLHRATLVESITNTPNR